MSIFSAIVVYAMLWFVTLLVVLVVRQPSQAEAGEVVEGTHAGAPANPQMKRRFLITTVIALALWVPLVWVIVTGRITIDDLDVIGRAISGS